MGYAEIDKVDDEDGDGCEGGDEEFVPPPDVEEVVADAEDDDGLEGEDGGEVGGELGGVSGVEKRGEGGREGERGRTLLCGNRWRKRPVSMLWTSRTTSLFPPPEVAATISL